MSFLRSFADGLRALLRKTQAEDRDAASSYPGGPRVLLRAGAPGDEGRSYDGAEVRVMDDFRLTI